MTVRIGAVVVLIVLSGCVRAEPVVVPAAAPASMAGAVVAVPPASEESARAPYVPTVGMEGKDVVWVPTPDGVVDVMLDIAKVTPDDFVMDLGSGDGRNIIAAARRGARGLGVEYNPDLVELSRRRARDAGVADRAQFVEGDMYEADISKATVLTLFLLPHNLERLKDNILALPPGTRVVVNTFTLEGWDAVSTIMLENDCQSWCHVMLLLVPAQVAGEWRIEGGGRFSLAQDFEAVSGSFTRGDAGAEAEIAHGRVRAADLTLTVGPRTYVGRVAGGRISGTVTDASGGSAPWTAVR